VAIQPPVLAATLALRPDAVTAWVVADSLTAGRAMGGTRMTNAVTEEEVRALARVMTVKLALAGLQIGGAKAGIRAAPDATQRPALLRSFGAAVAPLLHGGIYLGSDQGITHADRDTFLAAGGFDVRNWPGLSALRTDWASLWHQLGDITGYGVVVATQTAARRLALLRAGPRPMRVVVQGFGTVGRAVSRELARCGHSVVAVADVHGTLAAPAGLPVQGLLASTDPWGTIDRTGLPDWVSVTAEPDAWLDVDADVLVLAAAGDAVHEDNMRQVHVPLIVEGGNLCCTPQAREWLRSSGVVIVPDVVANVGAAGATGCILTGVAPSGRPAGELVAWLFDWVAACVTRNCEDVLEISAGGAGDDPVPVLQAARRQSLATA
jgi:glutamate dehydrogenase (NAD(P)+)